MRRRSALMVLGGLFVVALGLGGPAAQALDKTFTFPDVRIDATVRADGSLDLVERRTFLFSGGDFSVGDYAIDWPPDLIEGFGVTQAGQPLNVRDVSSGPDFGAEWGFPTFETGRPTGAWRARS